ncbi:MAG: endolytic transglycosylase MltG, partial [Bacteroidales bacterium]|nr:endolytic transglycosylase MltG [Bacteroidales bacterium]
LFIPDTYEVWWNSSPGKLMQLFARTYDEFWNEERRAKAAELGLSPVEVSVLASIIEEESNVREEYPVIAGLYLNRLRRRMFLQACPTVKFALNDFSIQRVLKEHTEVHSPYNTYKHLGLPPGPIRIPEKSTLLAVLNAEKHNYLYMCAKDDFSGRHYFSSSLAQHNRYAQKYHRALNQRRILK